MQQTKDAIYNIGIIGLQNQSSFEESGEANFALPS